MGARLLISHMVGACNNALLVKGPDFHNYIRLLCSCMGADVAYFVACLAFQVHIIDLSVLFPLRDEVKTELARGRGFQTSPPSIKY